MHKILATLIVLFLFIQVSAQEQKMVDKIIGVVGDNIILMSDCL